MRRAFATRLAPDGVARPAYVPSVTMPHEIMKKSPQRHEGHEESAVESILRDLRGLVVKLADSDPKTNGRFGTEHDRPRVGCRGRNRKPIVPSLNGTSDCAALPKDYPL